MVCRESWFADVDCKLAFSWESWFADN